MQVAGGKCELEDILQLSMGSSFLVSASSHGTVSVWDKVIHLLPCAM